MDLTQTHTGEAATVTGWEKWVAMDSHTRHLVMKRGGGRGLRGVWEREVLQLFPLVKASQLRVLSFLYLWLRTDCTVKCYATRRQTDVRASHTSILSSSFFWHVRAGQFGRWTHKQASVLNAASQALTNTGWMSLWLRSRWLTSHTCFGALELKCASALNV